MHFKEMKEIMEGKQMDLAAAKYVLIRRVLEISCEVDGTEITDEQKFEYIKVIREPMHKHKILEHILVLIAEYETRYGPDYYEHATVYYAMGVVSDAYDLPSRG
jgi:uncharacterized ubiquitin-like protein YukD